MIASKKKKGFFNANIDIHESLCGYNFYARQVESLEEQF